MSRLSIEIPDTLHQQIKATASLRGLSLRDFVLQQLGLPDNRRVHPKLAHSDKETAGDAPTRGSMLELIRNRPWQGTMTKAEIDAYIAEERASWNDRYSKYSQLP